jgi:DNA-binding NarL/FixJ family response regulator
MNTFPPNVLSIAVVEPVSLIVDGIQARISQHDDLQLAGVATNGQDAIAMLLESQPHVAIVEIDLAGRSGFDIVAELTRRHCRTRVLLHAFEAPNVYVAHTLHSRAAGLRLKSESSETLVNSIRTVASGGLYFAPEIEDRLRYDVATGQPFLDVKAPLAALTPRQLEVVRHLALGLSGKEVASELHISTKSVESHRYRAMRALGVRDRVSLSRLAIHEGLIT